MNSAAFWEHAQRQHEVEAEQEYRDMKQQQADLMAAFQAQFPGLECHPDRADLTWWIPFKDKSLTVMPLHDGQQWKIEVVQYPCDVRCVARAILDRHATPKDLYKECLRLYTWKWGQ